jgi:hypothetical protein
MITTYTFGKKNNNTNSIPFCTSSKPNYSKIIDAGIIADIIDKNKYLFGKSKKNDDTLFLSLLGKKNTAFDNAVKFLANYKTYKKSYNIPYIYGKMYTLSDGTPIVFYEDEVQIGFDSYYYSNFSDLAFLNSLNADTKKLIINIYTNGAANIDINIL